MVDAATAWDKAEDGLPPMPIFRDNNFPLGRSAAAVDDLEVNARFKVSAYRSAAAISASPRYEYEHAFGGQRSTSPSRT
jgi:hypothetical protein